MDLINQYNDAFIDANVQHDYTGLEKFGHMSRALKKIQTTKNQIRWKPQKLISTLISAAFLKYEQRNVQISWHPQGRLIKSDEM